ncbi:hypothetical protein HNY73_001880 [Argiope bruennichi]|uniref:Secreted protein n=1 Tax=Argiope bruennichi TaxID=94029 RepID=A0A8T0FT83_ARGBR|nr:hypothetical protein HNY73_001880 [Argiope bruennichi]
MKSGSGGLFRYIWSTTVLWAFFSPLISKCSATTATPVPVFQVTPPSDAAIAVTSRPSLYHETTLYEKNSAEHYIATWNTTSSLRGGPARGKAQQQTSSEIEDHGNYHIIRGSSQESGIKDAERIGSSEQQRERELQPNDNHIPIAGHVDPNENELIEQPKQLYPPVPGAGYIPPAK